jgi:hypothetical protein
LLITSAVAIPTFASRKGLLKSNKKQKLSIQQSFQRIFAHEFVTTNDANRGTNRATPNESMAESFNTDAKDSPDEQMVEQGCNNREDGNNSNESYALADDDSLFLVQEDDHSNNVGLDDLLGTDLFSFDDDALGVNRTSNDDDAQSREAPADQLGADVKDAPTTTCTDEEEYPPTGEENVKFTDLDVASLCLLQLCNNSGTHRGLYNNILAFLHWLVKKKVDITKAKGRASFIATMQAKVKCPRPASKKVRGRDIVYFPFIDLVQDLLRSNVFYDSSKTMELLALDDTLKDLIISPVKSKAESANDAIINKTTTMMKL